jgi:hypothetical protein
MPSVFESRFKRLGFPLLLRELGEDAVVDPSTDNRSIRVLIERNPPVEYDEAGNAYLDDIMVRCYNDATTGISATAVQRGITEISVVKRGGGSEMVTKTVVAVETQANGVLAVRLR